MGIGEGDNGITFVNASVTPKVDSNIAVRARAREGCNGVTFVNASVSTKANPNVFVNFKI